MNQTIFEKIYNHPSIKKEDYSEIINFSTFGNVFLVRRGMQFRPIIIPMNIIIAIIF